MTPTQMCANCWKEPGTERWGDALAFSHGFEVLWCKRCVLTTQIAHAEERAAALPELRARLAALDDTQKAP